MFDYFGHSVQNYGESLIFALIFNFRRLKLQRFFKRETMKCVKVKKYTHTTQFDFLLFCFNFYLSHSISVENFQLLCESKGTNTLLYISFADWTLLWTTFRYWNFLLFPRIDSQFEKWSACCIVFTTKTFHIVTQRPSFKKKWNPSF